MTLNDAKELVATWVNTNNLLLMLECVETKGGDLNAPRKPNAVGDNGRAFGIYQIHGDYVLDVNAFFRKKYNHEAAFVPELAKEIVQGYLARWGTQYRKNTTKIPTYETLARIHNGGPYGWKHSNTDIYWEKCKPVLLSLGVKI